MAGNLRELCWDRYATNYYTVSPTTDPEGPDTGAYRVFRGGDWFDNSPDLTCAVRHTVTPTAAATTFGFRCVQVASAPQPVQQTQNVYFGAPAPTSVTAPTNLTLTAYTDTGESGSLIKFSIINANPANCASITSGGGLTVSSAGTFTVQVVAAAWSANNTNYLAATNTLPVTAAAGNSSGYVDPTALTNLLSTGKITLDELKQVLAVYDHTTSTNIVNYAALASFIGNDTVTVNDFTLVSGSFISPGGLVQAAQLSLALGAPTNIVDQNGLNAVLAHYWLQSPPYLTNVAFPGATNLTFTITNFALTVQSSTNLTTWTDLNSPAKIQFSDPNAAVSPAKYYRLVGSTNY
jgi:hypothetical protein